MNVVRKSELFCKAVDWLTETSKSRAETYNTLRHWGMTDEEIKEIPSMADFIDDGSKESLYISAFVQCKSDIGNDSLVLPLPTAQSDMLLKLKSIGLKVIPHIADGIFISVKLMTEHSTGCHFIKLFTSEDTLPEASNTLFALINSPDEIWPVLRDRMVEGCYTSYKDLLDDIELLKRSYGEYVTSFYFPLYGELYDPDSCQSDSVSNRYLRNYKSEIEMLLEDEQKDDMTKYFGEDDSKSASKKIVSIKWDVTEFTPSEYNNKFRSRTIFGVVQIRHSAPFTDEEKSSIKDWIEGQNSDGFGEGLEDRGIDTEDGILYVHLWESGDEGYFIYDEAQMNEYIKYGEVL